MGILEMQCRDSGIFSPGNLNSRQIMTMKRHSRIKTLIRHYCCCSGVGKLLPACASSLCLSPHSFLIFDVQPLQLPHNYSFIPTWLAAKVVLWCASNRQIAQARPSRAIKRPPSPRHNQSDASSSQCKQHPASRGTVTHPDSALHNPPPPPPPPPSQYMCTKRADSPPKPLLPPSLPPSRTSTTSTLHVLLPVHPSAAATTTGNHSHHPPPHQPPGRSQLPPPPRHPLLARLIPAAYSSRCSRGLRTISTSRLPGASSKIRCALAR
ncbi:hypothetical protein Vafri_20808 [Volvox africanus]|uniref:Uncharacterized protein n=1 Tax=Volvox africanus TaxID=51714 RepID=A0A8J4BXN3_9CHLO|nr:hypothetical protein Vafri_20808 [Volvox africanus]